CALPISGSTPDSALGPERADHRVVRFDIWAPNEIQAIRYGGEHTLYPDASVVVAQTFQCFAYRLGLAGQVDDERRVIIGFAQDRHLAAQNRGVHEGQAHL